VDNFVPIQTDTSIKRMVNSSTNTNIYTRVFMKAVLSWWSFFLVMWCLKKVILYICESNTEYRKSKRPALSNKVVPGLMREIHFLFSVSLLVSQPLYSINLYTITEDNSLNYWKCTHCQVVKCSCSHFQLFTCSKSIFLLTTWLVHAFI